MILRIVGVECFPNEGGPRFDVPVRQRKAPAVKIHQAPVPRLTARPGGIKYVFQMFKTIFLQSARVSTGPFQERPF